MNRNVSDSRIAAGRAFPSAVYQHHRGHSLTAAKDSDENLDLFSKTRRSISVASSNESPDVPLKLGRLSIGSAKLNKSGIDDLLSNIDGGKHDYDWLLTPPGTPLFPSSSGSESQPSIAAPRSSVVRSTSTAKTSRLSISHLESSISSRLTRSSSVTRPSISTSQYSNTYSYSKATSLLNTSSSSVSSYIRPSSPNIRTPSTGRPSTPSARNSSRSSTPSRARPAPTNSLTDKSRPSQISRPSTPNSRPQIPANFNSPAVRLQSRPSTPTRRSPMSTLSSAAGSSIPAGRVLSNGRNSAPTSRPNSPGPRGRSPQPVMTPDFPLDTPPNLRTTLPDRPLSAGRSRPGVSATVKGNQESPGHVNMPRRPSSPIVSRGRPTEPLGRSRGHANEHVADVAEPQKTLHVPDLGMRKPAKTSTTVTDSTGFGRTISKKSLDMAIRHMDIRNGTGSVRPLSGTTLFPQSVRSATSRTESTRARSVSASVNISGSLYANNSIVTQDNDYCVKPLENMEADARRFYAKLSEVDMYESSRYDAILLKEDLKNTNWLHGVDDKSDQGLIFDNGYESLPEPFGLL